MFIEAFSVITQQFRHVSTSNHFNNSNTSFFVVTGGCQSYSNNPITHNYTPVVNHFNTTSGIGWALFQAWPRVVFRAWRMMNSTNAKSMNQWCWDLWKYCKSSNSIATFIIFPIQVAKHGGITVYPQFLRNQLDMGVIDPDVHEAFDPSQGGIVSFFSFSGYTPWLFNIATEKVFF